MKISVQYEDFDIKTEIEELRKDLSVGAVVTFLGTVRDLNDGARIDSMTLEYYPGMTEKTLRVIAEKAMKRWDINDITVIHRVGSLSVSDQIVLVAVAGKHRGAAFDACEFIIDFLKTEAPFWKKEELSGKGTRWVESHQEDEEALKNWH